MSKICHAIALLAVICLVSSCAKQGMEPEKSSLPGISRPNFSTPVTFWELRDAFYKYSVVQIVNALRENNEKNLTFVFNKAASGDPDWVNALSHYIAPGTDTSSVTGVSVALAYALQNNPKAVLYFDLQASGPSLYKICRLPFIDPEYEFIKDYGEKTLTALRSVDDVYIKDSRDVCIRRLQESLDYYDEVYKAGKWDQ